MLGDGMIDAVLGNLMTWFVKKGVVMISGVKEYVEINDKGLTIVDQGWDQADLAGRHLRLGAAADVQRRSPAQAEGEGARGLRHRRLHAARPHRRRHRHGSADGDRTV